jgi:hypothetical protein
MEKLALQTILAGTLDEEFAMILFFFLLFGVKHSFC